MTLEVTNQLVGVLVLVVPLVAIHLNLAGTAKRRSSLLTPDRASTRWRLEIYSMAADASSVLVDPVEIPFPVKRVRSDRAAGDAPPAEPWTQPRFELDVDVSQPFADDALESLFGSGHRVRFVSGSDAVIDVSSIRLRIRALRVT